MLFSSGCGLVDLVLGMSGRTGWSLINSAVALTVNISVDLLLIPELGIRGAAIGWAVAILAANLLPILEIGSLLRIHPFGRATFLAAALTTGCYGLASVVARLVWGDTAVALVTALLVGTAFYLPALWRLRGVWSAGRRPTVPTSTSREPVLSHRL
jgi:O-antigen/teichoic acid export membrane protein